MSIKGFLILVALFSLARGKLEKKEVVNDNVASRIPVLFISLHEGDGARLMTEAAVLLSESQDFNCSLILVGNNQRTSPPFPVPPSKPAFKIFQVNTNESEATEGSNVPFSETEISSHLSACTTLLQNKELVEYFRKSPPRLVFFPGFLQDACLLNIFRGPKTAAIVWSTGAVSSAWLGYATNAVPFSVYHAPLQPRASSTILERFQDTRTWTSFTQRIETYYWRAASALVTSHIKDPELNLDEAYQQVALMMSASHFLIERPVASLPMRVTIGCFHCRHAQPLPQELQEWVLPRRSGMVVATLPVTKSFAELLSITARELPQYAFLWLGYSNILVNESSFPANLVIHPLCPEQDALGHSRARLVVSQCSETEVLGSVFHGIPLICLPKTFDQHVTASRVSQLGIGFVLSPTDLLVFADSAKTITGNSSYRHAARHLGVMMRDEPETAADRLVFWCGHVARHWGHGHENTLQVARQAPRYFTPLLDAGLIIGTILGILLSILIIWGWRFLAARRSKVIRNKTE